VKKFLVLAGLLVLTTLLIAPVTIVPSGGGGAGPGGDAGGTNARIAMSSGFGTNINLLGETVLSDPMGLFWQFQAGGGVFWGAGGVSQFGADGSILLPGLSINVAAPFVNSTMNWTNNADVAFINNGTFDCHPMALFTSISNTGSFTNGGNARFLGNTLATGITNNGSFTNAGSLYNTGSMTNGTGFTNGGPVLVRGTTLTTGQTNNGDFTNAGGIYNTGSFTNGSGFTNGGPVKVLGTTQLTGATNNGSFTNAGNLYNTGSMTNGTGFTNGGSAQILGTTLTTGQTNNGSFTNAGNLYNTGSITNGVGFTNGGDVQINGTLLVKSNVLITAGQSTSNSWNGGTYYYGSGLFTNLNAAGTMSNLANVSIAAHVLTNNGDSIHAMWGGVMPSAAANTNQFQIIYGSQTIIDTGLQIASNTVFRAEVFINRTGNTAQHVEGRFEWGPGGGVPFALTNANLELVQTNGIATLLALKGGARAVGAHTNNSFRVWFDPGPR
jgi:hypothetical protein